MEGTGSNNCTLPSDGQPQFGRLVSNSELMPIRFAGFFSHHRLHMGKYNGIAIVGLADEAAAL